MNTAASFADSITDGLFVNGKSNRFYESSHRACCIRMRQNYAMYTGSEHLREHPRIRVNGCLVCAINRHIDNDRGRAMTAFGRTTGSKSLHVLGKTLDVIRRMFHVIADVVRIGLSVFLPLLETALRAGMRASVIDGLSLREQIDRSIDPLWLRGLSCGRKSQRYKKHADHQAREKFSHGFPPQCFWKIVSSITTSSRIHKRRKKHDCCCAGGGIVNSRWVCETDHMKARRSRCHGHRFPAEIISHAVWLYHRLCLSDESVCGPQGFRFRQE